MSVFGRFKPTFLIEETEPFPASGKYTVAKEGTTVKKQDNSALGDVAEVSAQVEPMSAEYVNIIEYIRSCGNHGFNSVEDFVSWYYLVCGNLHDRSALIFDSNLSFPTRVVDVLISKERFQFILSQEKKELVFRPDATQKNYKKIKDFLPNFPPVS